MEFLARLSVGKTIDGTRRPVQRAEYRHLALQAKNGITPAIGGVDLLLVTTSFSVEK